MKSCDVQNVTRDLFLLMLCINRRENDLIAASKSSVKFPPLHTMTLQLVCTRCLSSRTKASASGKKEHFWQWKNVSLRQSPRLLVKLPTRPQKITLRSARRMEATAVGSSHSSRNRCALSKCFPIMSLRAKSKSEMLPFVLRSPPVFFQLLYLTLFCPPKKTASRSTGLSVLRYYARFSDFPRLPVPHIHVLRASHPLFVRLLSPLVKIPRPPCPPTLPL